MKLNKYYCNECGPEFELYFPEISSRPYCKKCYHELSTRTPKYVQGLLKRITELENRNEALTAVLELANHQLITLRSIKQSTFTST